MLEKQTNNRNIKILVAASMVACGVFAACQETVTVAEDKLFEKNQLTNEPVSTDSDNNEPVSTDSDNNEPVSTDSDNEEEGQPSDTQPPPPTDVCEVIPDLAWGKTVAMFADGSAVVGGRLNEDVYADVVFGAGEENETVLPTDPYGPNQGFVAKYNADFTLSWAKGGMSRVGRVIAEEDGGVLAVLPRYVYADPDNLKILKLDAQGETVWSLSVPYGDAIAVNDAGELFVAGSFSDTVTLGEGDTAVTFENTDPQASYISYVAAYDADQSLLFAVALENLYLSNDIAVSDDAIAVVDNSGTLVYLNGEGEEVWRRQAGSDTEIDPDVTMIAGCFIDFGTTTVDFATDGSVLWTGKFEVSVVFSDDQGNEASLFAPYELTQYGGTFAAYPFVAHYTAAGALINATSSADEMPEPKNPGC